MDAARANAREAVELANKTLNEANQTLYTLLGTIGRGWGEKFEFCLVGNFRIRPVGAIEQGDGDEGTGQHGTHR